MNLGFKHIPTPSDTTTKEIEKGITNFINKLAWKEYFQTKNGLRYTDRTPDYDPYFKIPNREFTLAFPKNHQSVKKVLLKTLDTYNDLNPPKNKYDETFELRQFLKEHPDIRLVLSDKNLGIVALKTLKYHELVMEHLLSEKYELIGNSAPPFFQPFYGKLIYRFNKILDKIQSKETNESILKYVGYYRAYHKWTIPYFHVLIKLHKGLNPLKSRPIVSAFNWITTPISKILSSKLRPLISKFTHICRNSTDTVHSINIYNRIDSLTILREKQLLVTLDITDLYTNIDISRLGELLEKQDPYLKDLMQFVCENNYMNYKDNTYRQTNGIAMGTNAAPELANFYLIKLLDHKLISNQSVALYNRFLDDVFLIWTGSTTELVKQIKELATITGLGFKIKTSKVSVDYLDLKIFQQNGKIHYCTHQKALNKYGYISPKSCHPKHTFSGFIKAELNRYATNSSKAEYYYCTKRLFYDRLLRRGYQRRFLNVIFDKHKYEFRLKPKPPPTKELGTTTLSFRYSYRFKLHKLSSLLRIQSEYYSSKFIRPHKTRFAWRRSRNMFDWLCSSPLTPSQASYLIKNGVK